MSKSIVAAPEFWIDRLLNKPRSWGRNGICAFNLWRKRQAQNALEKALAQIIEVANGHRAKGLTKGSPAYVVLRDMADCEIQAFVKKWDVDVASIEAQAPALADLRALCVPDRLMPAGLKLLFGFLAVIVSLLLLGAASGLVHAGHDWVIHLLAR
jgi:hypothetical protein